MISDGREAIRKAVATLPLWSREVYWLSAVEGLDHDSIAARLGIARDRVEALLAEAILALGTSQDSSRGGEGNASDAA